MNIEDLHKPEDGTDYMPALERYKASHLKGGRLTLEAKTYFFSTFELNTFYTIEGEGENVTEVQLPIGQSANIRGGLLRDLGFKSLESAKIPVGGVPTHGIVAKGWLGLDNVAVSWFSGNGVHIHGDLNSNGVNANTWRIVGGRSFSNGGHGLFVDGADANAGSCYAFRSTRNGGWGIWESSLIGNQYDSCGISSNAMGAVKCDKSGNKSIFKGSYIEGATGVDFNHDGVIGANEEGDVVDLQLGQAWNGGHGDFKTTSLSHVNKNGFLSGLWKFVNKSVRFTLGSGSLTDVAFELDAATERNPMRMTFSKVETGAWEMIYANLRSACGFGFAGDTFNARKVPIGMPKFPLGFVIGNLATGLRIGAGLTPPTDLSGFQAGDMFVNTNPGIGGISMWRLCKNPDATLTWHEAGRVT